MEFIYICGMGLEWFSGTRFNGEFKGLAEASQWCDLSREVLPWMPQNHSWWPVFAGSEAVHEFTDRNDLPFSGSAI